MENTKSSRTRFTQGERKGGEEEFPRRATRWSHHHKTTSWMVLWMDLGRNPAGVQSKSKSTIVPWDTHYSSVNVLEPGCRD